jgi:hypothetical protein
LERSFDDNDVPVKAKGPIDETDISKCNIGTETNPKFIKLSSSMTREHRAEYVEILKQFVNVFT